MMKTIEEKHSQPITVRVRPGVKDALVEISEKTNVSISALVRESIKTITLPKDALKLEDMH